MRVQKTTNWPMYRRLSIGETQISVCEESREIRDLLLKRKKKEWISGENYLTLPHRGSDPQAPPCCSLHLKRPSSQGVKLIFKATNPFCSTVFQM